MYMYPKSTNSMSFLLIVAKTKIRTETFLKHELNEKSN